MPEWWEEEPEGAFRPAVNPAELQSNQPLSFNAQSRQAYNNGESDYWARWGGPGHEHEYTVRVRGYGKDLTNPDTFIPQEYADSIQAQLGQAFQVMNRGTRIEVRPEAGRAADAVVRSALEVVFNSEDSPEDVAATE